jgi:glucose-6-phosphate 1-dehydrogenase
MDIKNEKRRPDNTIMASITTPNLEIPFKSCIIDGKPDPCMIVVVGASGDLTARKIVPALYNLHLNDGLPYPFVVVGCARTKLSSQEFRDNMKNALKTANILNDSKWEDFSKLFYYQVIDYGDLSSFKALSGFLKELDKKKGTAGNRVFYLAIPPSLYKSTAQMLGEAGLAMEGENEN